MNLATRVGPLSLAMLHFGLPAVKLLSQMSCARIKRPSTLLRKAKMPDPASST